MNGQAYRKAFWTTLMIVFLLAGALAYQFIHPRAMVPVDQSEPIVARGPASEPRSAPPDAHGDSAALALAPVQIAPERLQQIGVTTAVVEQRYVTDQLQVPGNVDVDEQRLAYVQTRFPGWIQNVFANATWQYVRKGQRLFTIYSPDLVSTEQEYLLAKQNQAALSTGMHGTAAQEGGWLLQAAEDRLRQFDIPGAEIARLQQSGRVQREIVVNSPVSGYVTERNALPNAYVQPDTKLYTIADLSTVWVYANVFQNDVGRLKPGDPAQVTVDSYPGRTFRGHIDQILPSVDPATRTVRVRLIFSNPGVVLKPGMYVSVKIAVPLGRQLVMPVSGVLQAGTRQIAFIDHGGGNLEPREIQTGPQLDDSVVVLKGLQPGDRIVSSANFLVDSEAQLQSALGPAASPSQPPTSPAAAAQSAQITFSTSPSPPRKGMNTVEVHLTGPDAKPVSGTQVNVTFFMPAMPGMGMGAMRAAANLTDKGQGVYAGSLQLGSGGTWQVTIVATRNGQTLATKQLSVSASGGM